jgi:hypothetical protein
MDYYRAALKRRRPKLWRRLSALGDALREPIDTTLVIGIVFGTAILLACAF